MKKFFYRVADGDSVFSVAERFNVPIAILIKDNNLTRDLIAGDLLYIERAECRVYKVMPCDTLCGLARKFNTTEQKILSDNNIEYIFYGITIKI